MTGMFRGFAHFAPGARSLAGASVLLLAACGTAIPTSSERVAEDKSARVAQMLRVGEITRQGGDLVAAITLYRRAHKLDPEAIKPLLALGATADSAGQYGEATEAFRKAIALDGKNAEARLGFAKSLINLDRTDLAIAQFRILIAANTKDHRVFNGLGVALSLAGDHEAAEKAYIDGLEIAPENLALRNNLALSLALAGNFDEAIRILRKVAADPRATPRNRLNLALVFGLAGQPDRAARIAGADLNQRQVKNNLAYYERLRKLSDEDRAQEVFGPSEPPAP